MRFTKLGHSCVRLEKDGAVVVIDPRGWSDAAAAPQGEVKAAAVSRTRSEK
jgi:L-ascorbate metabolism protein UlaG (beta-lactamase superfamily)